MLNKGVSQRLTRNREEHEAHEAREESRDCFVFVSFAGFAFLRDYA